MPSHSRALQILPLVIGNPISEGRIGPSVNQIITLFEIWLPSMIAISSKILFSFQPQNMSSTVHNEPVFQPCKHEGSVCFPQVLTSHFWGDKEFSNQSSLVLKPIIIELLTLAPHFTFPHLPR